MNEHTAYFNLPADAYPFTIERYSKTGDLIDRMTVPGPGPVQIGAVDVHHRPCTVKFVGPDGEALGD